MDRDDNGDDNDDDNSGDNNRKKSKKKTYSSMAWDRSLEFFSLFLVLSFAIFHISPLLAFAFHCIFFQGFSCLALRYIA
jgi:hypothetical protein